MSPPNYHEAPSCWSHSCDQHQHECEAQLSLLSRKCEGCLGCQDCYQIDSETSTNQALLGVVVGTHLEPLSGLFWAILDILNHRRTFIFIGLPNSTTFVKPVRVRAWSIIQLTQDGSSSVAIDHYCHYLTIRYDPELS